MEEGVQKMLLFSGLGFSTFSKHDYHPGFVKDHGKTEAILENLKKGHVVLQQPITICGTLKKGWLAVLVLRALYVSYGKKRSLINLNQFDWFY
jgi:hypothetical protein